LDLFANFAPLGLDDVYVFHSDTIFLPDAAMFSIFADRILKSKRLQARVRLRRKQGVDVDNAMTVSIIHPYMVEQLGHSTYPNSTDQRLLSGDDLRCLCNARVPSLVLNVWLTACDRNLGDSEALGLACGWIFVQWLEWSHSTPEAFAVNDV
jgi:hypothetical protein